MDNIIALLEECVKSKHEIVIFGSGMMGEYVLQYFLLKSRNVDCVIDNNQVLWGGKIKKVNIISPEQATKKYPKAVYVVCNLKYCDEMKQQLIRAGIDEKNIILCDSQHVLRQEINNMLPMKYENKYFIFDTPYQKGLKHMLNVVTWQMKAIYYRCLMDIVHPKNATTKKYNVSICAIFKNEAPYLKEWIEYHKLIGVEHFYLYNNFSNDDYMSILKDYIDEGDVTLTEWPYEQAQMQAYTDCVQKRSSDSKWIGFIDLDEFVVPLDSLDLYDILKKFEKNRGSVIIYWKMFGSSGKVERDLDKLVTEDFIVSWKKHTNIGKIFFNTAYDFLPDTEKNHVMHHRMWTGYKGKIFPPVNVFDKVCIEELNSARKSFPVQINHYFTKSVQEWKGKQTKGDVYFKRNPHDEQYFYYHEMKNGEIDVSIYKYLIKLKLIMNK